GFNLTIDDSANSAARNATLGVQVIANSVYGSLTGLAPAAITYDSEARAVTIDGGSGGNSFTIANTPILGPNVHLNTGIGADTVTIKGVAAGTALNIDGQSGTDPVNVGNNGSVQGILGTVTLRNDNAFEAVTVDDSADASNRIVTMSVLGGGDGHPLATI